MSKINSLYLQLFRRTDKPYIPLLRIFLVLISLKELITVSHKFRAYFSEPVLFYRSDALTDALYALFSSYPTQFFYLFVIVGCFAALGLMTRWTLSIYALTYLMVIYFDTSTGIYNHETGLSVQILLVLSMAPGIKNFSLDNLIKNRFQFNSWLKIESYNDWGLKLIMLLIVLGYFTAGVSKIRYGTFNWMDGETLSYYLSGQASFLNPVAQKFIPVSESVDWKGTNGIVAYTYGNFQSKPQLIEWTKILSKSDWLMSLLSVVTILFELGALGILFWKPYRVFFLLSAVGFHFSIRLFMGLGFLDYQVICLCLVDWPYLYSYLTNLIKWIKQKMTF
ncbi:HTTM domain-containing protein [Reichenbachiella agarivorans]|uniref:HTTM domain-containing protein n=1 Tax=Reichenbachiella agarivorans TaxID=2979464 RepID=A0ABY6CVZ5_9BACT|nr:HTTM domain-containing protein [Reichenbachiella agarivorans]UXP32430.1 HTTM domain-containing protein [Reichenbachiella agarivorans]